MGFLYLILTALLFVAIGLLGGASTLSDASLVSQTYVGMAQRR
jgi:hypothetical protein